LVLERLALAHLATEAGITSPSLQTLREELRRRIPHYRRVSVEQRAFAVFQCAQVLGWDPEMLSRQSKVQWSKVVEETEAFSEIQRRRVYHLAYERRQRNQTLDAFLAVDPSQQPTPEKPRFQVICCLDDREESYRRHLEEIEPACETFGLAGFYGVAMYYRGVADAHYVPLCPIVIKPKHFVQEQVVDSYAESHRRRADTRRLIGRLAHGLHVGSRTVLGGILAAFFGSAASAPLVARVLFPRLTARMRRRFGRFVQPPPITRLSLERTADTPGKAPDQLGYSLAEMIDVAERMLRDAGLTTRFARLVIVTGHGSSSLNNPHEAAYNCGACGGARGGPNARAFAEMANDPRIRTGLAARGIRVPDDCVFIGAYHITCDESVVYFDRDLLPATHQADFESACQTIDEARARNAHERCRRFSSAELSMSREGALRHVEGRAEDLSQVRPEYCHATNAVCFVGRRLRTRGLYLDRRTFLTSYDPTEDDANATILTRVLQAALPVCAGINLEYYFSSVDTTGYGCGTKLPHNICGLLGVMDGAASDLRTGLSSQMVEIHEPLRCLFVIETSPEKMQRIFDRNPDMARLCVNDWVQLAVIDPASQSVQVFQEGRFSPYHPDSAALPVVSSSVDWYRGWRDHLGYARVQAKRESPPAPPRAI
jgi:uncharacterized protein YbcC (UPF0753/DUF2309 family)